MKKKLRKDQLVAIKACVDGLRKAPRGQLIKPCGTGKTLDAIHVAHKLSSRTVVVLVPSLALVNQALHDWLADAPFPFTPLLICGESDYKKGEKEDQECPDFEGFEVTTDPDVITTFFASSGKRVAFCTYHSSWTLAKAKIDLAIFDEAHRTAGDGEKAFAFALSNERVKIKKRLFMTATPRILSEQSDTEFSSSMDDAAVYGRVFFEMTFQEAIGKKLLVDFDVVIIGELESEIERIITLNQEVCETDNGPLYTGVLAGWFAMKRAQLKYKFKRPLVFHNTVAAAGNFASLSGGEFVSGEQAPAERREILSRFRKKGNFTLSNCRVLQEGINIPEIDAVVFCDPRRSVVDAAQALGRALRLYPGKKKAYVVIPVVVPEDADNLNGRFGIVGKVIKALKAVDPCIEQRLVDVFNARSGSSGAGILKDRKLTRIIDIELPEGLSEKLHKAIDVKLWTAVGVTWEMRFEELKTFLRAHNGEYPVLANNSTLVRWVTEQRRVHLGKSNRSQLTNERLIKLEALPNWSMRPREHLFFSLAKQAKAWCIKHKIEEPTKECPQYGWYLGVKRQAWLSTLARSRVECMDQLFSGWDVRKNGNDENKATKFFDDHGRWPRRSEPGAGVLHADRVKHRRGRLFGGRVKAYESRDSSWLTAGLQNEQTARSNNGRRLRERACEKMISELKKLGMPRYNTAQYGRNIALSYNYRKDPIANAPFILAHNKAGWPYPEDILKKAREAVKKQK